MTVSLFEAFIVSAESNMRLVSSPLCDGVICRLFGRGGEMGTEEPEMMLPGAFRLMETINEESEAHQ
jgi:hypothetical protein